MFSIFPGIFPEADKNEKYFKNLEIKSWSLINHKCEWIYPPRTYTLKLGLTSSQSLTERIFTKSYGKNIHKILRNEYSFQKLSDKNGSVHFPCMLERQEGRFIYSFVQRSSIKFQKVSDNFAFRKCSVRHFVTENNCKN